MLIDPVTRVNYKRNAGLALDADLALLLDTELKDFSGFASQWEREAHRLAFDAKCRDTQARV